MDGSLLPRFSIIVPYFNSADTLRRCVDSVISQTFSDWELLLVDDGSEDHGIYPGEDSRIRSFRQPHRGVSASRNRGIQEALGEYLLFLDADDYIERNYLLDFAEALSTFSSNICLSGLTRIERDGTSRYLAFPFSGLVSNEVILPSFYELQRTNQLYGYVAGKAVRRSFLIENHLFFNETLHKSEDLDFFLRCYEKCSSFLFIPNTDYHYIKYDGGTSLFTRETDYFSLIMVHRHLKSFCHGYLTDADSAAYRKTIAAWTDSAILETRPGQMNTLPDTFQRILQDPELHALLRVNGSTFRMTIRVFLRQTRLFFSRCLQRVCPK